MAPPNVNGDHGEGDGKSWLSLSDPQTLVIADQMIDKNANSSLVEKELEDLKKFKEAVEKQQAFEKAKAEEKKGKEREKHKRYDSVSLNWFLCWFDPRKRLKKKMMVKDLQEENKQLTKSLAEVKKGMKRSNVAVRELFHK